MSVVIRFFQLIFTLAIFPFVFAAVYHLPEQVVAYPSDVIKMFEAGAMTFLAVYVFVYSCREIHAAGKVVIEKLFGFAPFLQPVVTKIFSFYLFLIIILFFLLSRGFGQTQFNPVMMFLMGFFFAMHTVLVAVEMQEEDGAKFFKIGYLSSFVSILMVNIMILILLFDCIKGQFTILEYAQKVIESGRSYVMWAIDHRPFQK